MTDNELTVPSISSVKFMNTSRATSRRQKEKAAEHCTHLQVWSNT